ncbi:MAG: hypothetical protein H6679_00550 [Epsilonproteobacteria bacterium]|nr:hypothetical protein [Campylobacterota bacterium]
MKKIEIMLLVGLIAALCGVELMARQEQTFAVGQAKKGKKGNHRRPQKPAPKNPKKKGNHKKGKKKGNKVGARAQAALRRQLPKQV